MVTEQQRRDRRARLRRIKHNPGQRLGADPDTGCRPDGGDDSNVEAFHFNA